MIDEDLNKFSKNIKGKIKFNYSMKNLTWMNIGGIAKIFFIPETLLELKEFLSIFKNRKEKIFVIGAGSNLLVGEDIDKYAFVKLGKNFNKISVSNENIIIAGCSLLDKKVSDYACENGLGGLEFLSCIPGSIGGGIRMNSGCYGTEFKDVLESVQVIDFDCKIYSIKADKIKFSYRQTNLPKNLIFLSASFKCNKKNKCEILNKINELKKNKSLTQPMRVKTGGSTFKNPYKYSDKKVWELIKDSVDQNISFGDAKISNIHSNFFINSNNATYEEMSKLINFVKKEVKNKTGIPLDLEIEIVNS